MRALSLTAALLLASSTASGHGRPPMTYDVKFSDTGTMYVGTTIGLLVSHDDGCTFHWVCEENVGYGEYDPKLAVARDGTIFATTYNGLRISRDGGCSFTTAELPTGPVWVDALDLGPTGELWVGTSEGGLTNEVFASVDNGATFSPRGLASSALRWKSIMVAPSDATRVYVTGHGPGGAQAYRGDNGTWTALPLTGVALGSNPNVLVAAVDPTNRDIVYVISEDANAATDDDVVYRSSDGGTTFKEVFSAGIIHDVFVRDAQTVYVMTKVRAGPVLIGGPPYGSTDGGQTFAPLMDTPQLGCLAVSPDGTLIGCGANWMPDFMAVAALEGDTWTKVWRFVELAGPLDCPSNPGHDLCVAVWPEVANDLLVEGPTCGEDAPTIPHPSPPESCCGVSSTPASGLWAVALAWWLGRRRRARH